MTGSLTSTLCVDVDKFFTCPYLANVEVMTILTLAILDAIHGLLLFHHNASLSVGRYSSVISDSNFPILMFLWVESVLNAWDPHPHYNHLGCHLHLWCHSSRMSFRRLLCAYNVTDSF